MEKSRKEQALAWWKTVKFFDKFDLISKYHPNLLKEGYERLLTNKEIEEIWSKENPIAALPDELINTNFEGIEEEHCIKPNQKKFNPDLFKAYINKFSEEDKLEALYILDQSLLRSQIQEISTQFAFETQKQKQGDLTGWWSFIKNKFPKLYR